MNWSVVKMASPSLHQNYPGRGSYPSPWNLGRYLHCQQARRQPGCGENSRSPTICVSGRRRRPRRGSTHRSGVIAHRVSVVVSIVPAHARSTPNEHCIDDATSPLFRVLNERRIPFQHRQCRPNVCTGTHFFGHRGLYTMSLRTLTPRTARPPRSSRPHANPARGVLRRHRHLHCEHQQALPPPVKKCLVAAGAHRRSIRARGICTEGACSTLAADLSRVRRPKACATPRTTWRTWCADPRPRLQIAADR